MTITIDAAAELLNYHHHTLKAEIKTEILEGLELESLISGAQSEGDTYTCERITAGEILQPYQSGYTAKGSISDSESLIRVRPFKTDFDFSEADLEKYFIRWRAQWFEAGKDPMEWSFPKYITDKVIVPKILSEMNYNAWNGVYAAPTPPTPGASVDSVDGFKKVIADKVTAGTINVLASGAFTASTIRENVESFCDLLPDHVRGKGGRMLMSFSNRLKYARDYRDEFYANNSGIMPNNNQDRPIYVDGLNVELMGVRAMGASNRFIFIPNSELDNMIYVSRMGYPTLPEFIFKSSNPRVLHMSSTIYRGYGFEDPKNIWVNNQV